MAGPESICVVAGHSLAPFASLLRASEADDHLMQDMGNFAARGWGPQCC